MSEVLLGDPLVINREITAAGISATVIPHPEGIAVLVPAVHEPIDIFLVSVTYREPGATENRFTKPVAIANSGWGQFRHHLRCEYALFNVQPSMVRSVFIEPLQRCGPVAAFSVDGRGLTGGVIGQG